MSALQERRLRAARAGFRAHYMAKNPPRLQRRSIFSRKGNPDLRDDLTDFVTDALHLARSLGDDPARVLRCAAANIEAEAPRRVAVITGELVGGSGDSAVYEITAEDEGERLDKSTVAAPNVAGEITAMTARLLGDGFSVRCDFSPGDYLARFPLEHRASADRAYSDGFADGHNADDSAFQRLLKAALDLRAATVDFDDGPDLDPAKAAFDDVLGALAAEGFQITIAPGNRG